MVPGAESAGRILPVAINSVTLIEVAVLPLLHALFAGVAGRGPR